MRRHRFFLPWIAMGVVLALAPHAGAQSLGQDSVTVSGEANLSVGSFSSIDIHATSGPSGENPSGRVFYVSTGGAGPVPVGSLTTDNVTCLAVSGNGAVIGFTDNFAGGPFNQVTVQVGDLGPANSALDRWWIPALGRDPGDCAGFIDAPGRSAPLTLGDAVVTNAPPSPTSKDQCKHGGWQTYGVFNNQGDCVSFVATGGKNPPANSP
jgi:hypothetical protein